MPAIAPQAAPANGQGLGGITWTQADAGGDTVVNNGKTQVLVRGITGWTTETAQLEGVPDASGRDGTATLNPQAINGIDFAMGLRTADYNAAGVIDVTYPGGITGLEIAAIDYSLI